MEFPFQNATAHDPQVHIKDFAPLVSYHNRYYTIVSELVDEFSVQVDILIRVCNFFDIRAGITLCRQVELIALICQLGDPVKKYGFKRPDHTGHLKRIQILSVIRKGRLKGCPLRIGPVHFVPLRIIG